MELIYYLIPFIVYLYNMDNITSNIVKNLLDTLVTPKFGDIVDYDITTREDSKGKTVVFIGVIMKHNLNFGRDIEFKVERRIRDVMKYISPAFVMVEFYLTNDYED